MQSRRSPLARAVAIFTCAFVFAIALSARAADAPFVRGNSNRDARIDLSDAVGTLLWLFGGGAAPACADAADVDDSGTITITDPIALLRFLFDAGPTPAPPYRSCATDPTLDELDCNVATCVPRASNDDLIAAYAFEEGRGRFIVDATGNGHDGELGSLVKRAADGRFGEGVELPVGAAVELPTIDLGTGPFSVSLWCRRLDGAAELTLGSREADDQSVSWELLIDTEGRPRFRYSSGATRLELLAPEILPVDVWMSVGVVRDHTAITLLVGGEVVASRASSGGDPSHAERAVTLETSGAAAELPGPLADELRFFRRALAPLEFREMMDSPVTEPRIDTAPPFPPRGLTGRFLPPGRVDLSWDAAFDDGRIDRYRILRESSDESASEFVTPTNVFVDESPASGTNEYRVVSVDGSGNESLPSESIEVLVPDSSDDTEPPSAPRDLVASPEAFGIRLAWQPSTDDVGVAGYSVWREGLRIGESTETEFLDESGEATVHTRYSVTAVDAAGNESLHSEPASAGHPFLHVVIEVPPWVMDEDGDGGEIVQLRGSASHTHESGHELATFEWKEDGDLFSRDPDPAVRFDLGPHRVTLRIEDDHDEPQLLRGSAEFSVVAIDHVPGALVLVHATPDPASSLDGPFGLPDRAFEVPQWRVDTTPRDLGPLVIRLAGAIELPSSGEWSFFPSGGVRARILLSGDEIDSGPGVVPLDAGTYLLEARFAVESASDAPLEVEFLAPDGTPRALQTTHDLSIVPPVLESVVPAEAGESGGSSVTLRGFGFFPEEGVRVLWGDAEISRSELRTTSTEISLLAPPGRGTVSVRVITPRGESRALEFRYVDGGQLPVRFDLSKRIPTGNQPTTATWGPDARLWVGHEEGEIRAIEVDEDWSVIDVQVIDAIAKLENHNVLGIGFDPGDDTGETRLWVAHGELYVNGGECFEGFSPYTGQISVLSGPDWATVEPIVTGLPVSNRSHGINGFDFDLSGNLYVCVGSATNAGVAACGMGGLDDSPLSGAVLRVELWRDDFNGRIRYFETETGLENSDQVFGGEVDVDPDVDVQVHAAGLRNPFDLAYTTRGLLFATDNGPNPGAGPASIGPDEQAPDPTAPDELLLVEEGGYYGSPNRNRGRLDARQNIYRGPLEPSIPGEFTQALMTLNSSTDGIVEYRANTFQGAMRGELIVQRFGAATQRISLTADGRGVAQSSRLFTGDVRGLDVTTGPGGVLLIVSRHADDLKIARPLDSGPGLAVWDIHPWRAPASGGHRFVLGGRGFGDLATTKVTIGGEEAEVTRTGPGRIYGVVPARQDQATGALDVVVASGGSSASLSGAFQYLEER